MFNLLQTSTDDVDLLYDENDQIAEEAGAEEGAKKEEEEEEGEEDEGERSWKR